MIDPQNPPNILDNSTADIQEFLLFSVLVAGKNAQKTAHALDKFLGSIGFDGYSLPLERIDRWLEEAFGGHGKEGREHLLATVLKACGIGCHSQKAKTIIEICDRNRQGSLRLKYSSTKELEEIWGIGFKTSRFFIMYTRPWTTYDYAILDVHVLSWLSDLGYDVPKSTPTTRGSYRNIEGIFIQEASKRGLTPLELDRAIWNSRREVNTESQEVNDDS